MGSIRPTSFVHLPGFVLSHPVGAPRPERRLFLILAAAAWLFGTLQPLGAQVGELQTAAGIATGVEEGGLSSGFLARGSFSMVRGDFSLGPEVQYVLGNDQRVLGLGAVARYAFQSRRVHPFLVLGLGGNFWREDEFGSTGMLAGSLGIGASLGKSRSPGMVLEVRFHENLQRLASARSSWGFVTMSAGLRFGWQ